jgi:cobalt/nickel transport system permease protein
MPMFAYPLLVGARAGLPAGFLLRKVLVASPFALLVAIGNPFFDRAPMAAVFGHGISGGWFSFASIMVRFVLTVWSALVLLASTGIHPLCSGMERLGMPRIFGNQVLFLHRYLFVIAEEGLRLHRAATVRGASTLRLVAYGSLLGQWLLRSMDRATRIHQAMRARGFDGQLHCFRRDRLGPPDILFVVAWSGFFFVARKWDLAVALARHLPQLSQ